MAGRGGPPPRRARGGYLRTLVRGGGAPPRLHPVGDQPPDRGAGADRRYRLLERPGGRRPVIPTPAGERVLRHARRVLDQIGATEADLADLATGDAGTVSLGTFQSASRRLLPDALRRLRTTHPGIEVRLDETPDLEQLGRLATGQIDLAFVLLPVDGPFDTRELVHDPFMFITARKSPRSDDRLPSLAELAHLPLISWQRAPFVLEALLESRGHHPHVVLRSDDSATVQGLVAAGLGSAVLPSFALDLPDPRLVVIDAGRHVPPRRIGLAWHRDRVPAPAILALIQALETACTCVTRKPSPKGESAHGCAT